MNDESPGLRQASHRPSATQLAAAEREARWYDGLLARPRLNRTVQIIARHPLKFLRWAAAKSHPSLRVNTVELFWGRRLRVDITDLNGKYLHFTGCLPAAELPLLAWVVGRLGPEDTFYDVGANWGVYSLLADDLGCRVHAFEPNPKLVEVLRSNFADVDVRVHEFALGSSEGEAILGIPAGHSGAGSIRKAGDQLGRRTVVSVAPLDSLNGTIDTPTFIKLDVEGFESDVLAGAAKTLDVFAPDISMEFHGSSWAEAREEEEAALEILRGLGYQLFLVHGANPDPRGSNYTYESIDRQVEGDAHLNLLFRRLDASNSSTR